MKRLFTLIMTLLLVSTFISAEETYQEKVKNVYLKYACLYKYGPNVSYESLSSSEKAGLKKAAALADKLSISGYARIRNDHYLKNAKAKENQANGLSSVSD